MENENRLKLRISRMFRSSFGSCKSRIISDVVDPPVLAPHNSQHHQLIDLFSPKRRPFPSIFRPKISPKPERKLYPRTKIFDRRSLLLTPAEDTKSPKCPPASPISPLDTLFNFPKSDSNRKEKKPGRKTKKRTQLRKKANFESFDDYYDWFSSGEDDSEVEEEDDDDEMTLFSSKSLSSDSSDSFRRRKARYRRKRVPKKEALEGLMPLQGKVKNSFAVVKRSSDPHSDFRTSMVEMIVERQIFGARDLENLLETFVSLNSVHHHGVIIDVFEEICDALFSNWA